MKYCVIDVETANHDYSSICQIGLVLIENGNIIEEKNWLINPQSPFNHYNSKIHKIIEADICDAPLFKDIYPKLSDYLTSYIVLHHTSFDRVAISRACRINDLELLDVQWLDSSLIVRKTWNQFSKSGYGLSNLANYHKIEFQHHDALQDAITTYKIVELALRDSRKNLQEWYIECGKPSPNVNKQNIQSFYPYYTGLGKTIKGNPDGPLNNHNIVFTGNLSIPRVDAAKIASKLGCTVSTAVSKKTTILVVGDLDTSLLAGYNKSSKQRKAEQLLKNGHDIIIMDELGFYELCNIEDD